MSSRLVVAAINQNAVSARREARAAADYSYSSRKAHVVVFAAILLLACALRLSATVGRVDGRWVIGSCDDPFLQQVEPIVRSGNPLQITVFWYPPVPAYLASAGVTILNSVGGPVDSGTGCRVVTLSFSLATVGLVYALGRLWGPRHALIAMALISVTMVAVVVQTNVQVYATFFVTLALYLMVRANESRHSAPLVLSGIALALAVASKYTPVLFAGMLFAPFFHRRLMRGSPMEAPELVQERTTDGAMKRIWPIGLFVVMVIGAVVLWCGIARLSTINDVLRQIYYRTPHENPFEVHRPWIDSLYTLALVVVGVLVAVCGIALVVPWTRRTSPWAWIRSFHERNRLWVLPSLAFAVTLGGAIVVPAALNLGDFARYFVGLLKMHSMGDYGMFPAGRSAPSYLAAYIPENMGLPIFVAGLFGLLYAGIRRDMRMAIIVASALPAYVAAEFARVKVNRYVLELMPVWILLASAWLADLTYARRPLWRRVAAISVAVIVCYSTVYSLAWARFASPAGDVRDDVASWVKTSIPAGASLGVTSGVILNGSPELLPDRRSLAGYTLLDYADKPDYVLLPNGVYAVVHQYLELTSKGYVYTAADWGLTRPSTKDLAAISSIVREDGYTLIKEFVKRPHVFGIDVPSASLTGRTWMVEHSAAAGIRIYRRAPHSKSATAG